MSLIVMKFGGTSVGSVERINAVADRVAAIRETNDDVVVVSSAMAGETDRLIGLGEEVSPTPEPSEMDVLLASGEQVAVALVALALQRRGVSARSFLGGQVDVRTDSNHMRALIEEIDTTVLRACLDRGIVPVIAGFQGVSKENRITTIGRGGSDTSAVAVAAALDADECRIYTDVDGVYTADPRVENRARRMDHVSFEEMLEMASLGAKVLHSRAVQFAYKHSVKLRVLSSFEDGPGTLVITEDESAMEDVAVAAVTHDLNEAKITIQRVPDKPGVAYQLLGPVGEAGISVDMIVQNIAVDGSTDMTFTVTRNDYQKAMDILGPIVKGIHAELEPDDAGRIAVVGDDSIAKVTVVGVGMRSHAGVATTMFAALANVGINIQMISTSEIKISVVIHEDFCELAVRVLHSAFGLDDENE